MRSLRSDKAANPTRVLNFSSQCGPRFGGDRRFDYVEVVPELSPPAAPEGFSMPIEVHAVNRSDVPPITMSDRFRTEVAYFMSLAEEEGVPSLGKGEYWIDSARSTKWLDDGEFHLVSPLDSGTQAEIELSEEQEAWLEWMTKHAVQHIRLQEKP